jgi:hypothetical protein
MSYSLRDVKTESEQINEARQVHGGARLTRGHNWVIKYLTLQRATSAGLERTPYHWPGPLGGEPFLTPSWPGKYFAENARRPSVRL